MLCCVVSQIQLQRLVATCCGLTCWRHGELSWHVKIVFCVANKSITGWQLPCLHGSYGEMCDRFWALPSWRYLIVIPVVSCFSCMTRAYVKYCKVCFSCSAELFFRSTVYNVCSAVQSNQEWCKCTASIIDSDMQSPVVEKNSVIFARWRPL